MCKFIWKSFNRTRSKQSRKGRGINRAGEGVLRAGYGNKKGRKNNQMDF